MSSVSMRILSWCLAARACKWCAVSGDRQHATILPRVRRVRVCTNCNPIPREDPLTTNTAFGSSFLRNALVPLVAALFRMGTSGNTG